MFPKQGLHLDSRGAKRPFGSRSIILRARRQPFAEMTSHSDVDRNDSLRRDRSQSAAHFSEIASAKSKIEPLLGDLIDRTWIYAHHILNRVVARLRIGVPFQINQSSRDARIRVAGNGGKSAIQSAR